MAVTLAKRAFTLDEYHRMVQAGILAESDRVELIRGEIVVMAPIGRRHAGQVGRLTRLFSLALGERAIVWVQNPLPLGPDSEPQPDVAPLRPCADFYVNTPPRPADVWLAIEVGDTSVAADRAIKVPLHAEAGLRETWLVDLPGERVEVYRTPVSDGYRDVRVLQRGQSLTVETFPDLVLSVDEILG